MILSFLWGQILPWFGGRLMCSSLNPTFAARTLAIGFTAIQTVLVEAQPGVGDGLNDHARDLSSHILFPSLVASSVFFHLL